MKRSSLGSKIYFENSNNNKNILFQLYTKISDKVVGLLMAAKKKGWVYFEPEILFQVRNVFLISGFYIFLRGYQCYFPPFSVYPLVPTLS